jgi:hypothetical protein
MTDAMAQFAGDCLEKGCHPEAHYSEGSAVQDKSAK